MDGTSIAYEYDVHGRLIAARETRSSDSNYKNDYVVDLYDVEGRIFQETNTINYLVSSVWKQASVSNQYSYNPNGTLKTEKTFYLTSEGIVTDYTYDNLHRVTNVQRRADGFVYDTEYEYVSSGYNTSYRVSKLTNTVEGTATTYSYTYDSNGNITKITVGGSETTYTYDDLGQLKGEVNGSTTYSYTYDDAGNITSIVETVYNEDSGITPSPAAVIVGPVNPPPLYVTYTNTLAYTNTQWGDLLTSFNGTAIT